MATPKVFVGFTDSSQGRWGSRLIRWFIGSPTHTFALVKQPWHSTMDEATTYETTPTVFQRRQYRYRKDTVTALFEVDLSDPTEAIKFWENSLGLPYDYIGIFGLGINYLLRKFRGLLAKLIPVPSLKKRVLANPFGLEGFGQCAEMVARGLLKGGRWDVVDPEAVDPVYLLEVCRSTPLYFKEVSI